MWASEKDTWLAAWRWWPQPPRSSWRPPFTPICTIFMEGSDFPSKNKPPFKEKTIDPPQQIPANLPEPERSWEWWTPAPPEAECDASLYLCLRVLAARLKGCQRLHQEQRWNIPDASCSRLPTSRLAPRASCSKWNVSLCCFSHLTSF